MQTAEQQADTPLPVPDQWIEVQQSLSRIIAMAGIIDHSATDLPFDCNQSRILHCANVIEEAAENAIKQAEVAEIATRALLRERRNA